MHFTIHTRGHNASAGGIITSTGFKINGDTTNEHFLDDDGAGILRLYYLSGTTRVYTSSTYGTVDYTNGEVVLTSANIASISNVDGAASTHNKSNCNTKFKRYCTCS